MSDEQVLTIRRDMPVPDWPNMTSERFDVDIRWEYGEGIIEFRGSPRVIRWLSQVMCK